MEFIVKTDLEAFPDVIETNADELMSELTEKLEKYNSLVVTPESIASAKNDKASLNKLRSALEERRKEIKRQCLAPYEQFEVKYKKLLALIDAPIKSIDTQIRLFDEMEVSEKRAHLQGYFEQQVCRAEGTFKIEFDKILNPKWKNKTMKETTLEREISETISRIQAEAKRLTEEYQNSPHLTAVLDRYAQNYDMMDALAYAATLVQWENQRRSVQQPPRAAEPAAVQNYIPVQDPPACELAEPSERMFTGTFRVTGTKQQITALGNFLRCSKIKFEIVKEK